MIADLFSKIPHFVEALLGGALLGLSSAVLFHFNGRIAGIAGIFGGLTLPRGDVLWRAIFVLGLLAGGALLAIATPERFGSAVESRSVVIVAAGLLVGFGTRFGTGCTSGHGICGLSRFSFRSLVATLTFIGAGAATIVITRAFVGGAGGGAG